MSVGGFLPQGPTVQGPNCPGPNCPGPNCPGPNSPGPNCPGPNCPGPNSPRTGGLWPQTGTNNQIIHEKDHEQGLNEKGEKANQERRGGFWKNLVSTSVVARESGSGHSKHPEIR